MRHYVQAAELKDAGMEWLDILHREGFAERTVLAAKIKNDPQYRTEAQRIEAFKEGLGAGAVPRTSITRRSLSARSGLTCRR